MFSKIVQLGATERDKAVATNIVPILLELTKHKVEFIAERAIAVCTDLFARVDDDEHPSHLVDVDAVLPIVTRATAELKAAAAPVSTIHSWLEVSWCRYFCCVLTPAGFPVRPFDFRKNLL